MEAGVSDMRNGEQRGLYAQEPPGALFGIRREAGKQESSCTGSKEPPREPYLFSSFTSIRKPGESNFHFPGLT